MEFIRNARESLTIEGEDPVRLDFHPNGYLTLASDEGFDQLRENFLIQRYIFNAIKLIFIYFSKIFL